MIDEPGGAEPTGAREHVNVPMEKVVRDNSDHLFPTFNTHIPDAPLPEDPDALQPLRPLQAGLRVPLRRSPRRTSASCRTYVDLYYPNDHGGGARDINPDGPDWSFKRFVQDNDAALGLTVELISNSPCWKDTVIFVVEDDTQNGADHVDGHRSIFLAISPWVKKEYVSKTHTSLASIFKTVNLILGLPPLNQYDAAATDLRDMFTGKPDFTPYTAPAGSVREAGQPALAGADTKDIDFSRPDMRRGEAAGGHHEVRGASAPEADRGERSRRYPVRLIVILAPADRRSLAGRGRPGASVPVLGRDRVAGRQTGRAIRLRRGRR